MKSKRRILIVDDDAAVRSLVRSVLEREGFEVTTARNGREAIAMLAAMDYDVVLLDVAMPKLDGVDVVNELSKKNSPILAHTYLLVTGQVDRLTDLPVRGMITKPFDVHALLAETKDCIGH